MRLLITIFSPPSEALGSVTRGLAVGSAARELGHEVVVCCNEEVARTFRKEGFMVYELPEQTFFGLPKVISDKIAEGVYRKKPDEVKTGEAFGNNWMVLVGLGAATKKYLKSSLEIQLAAIKAFKPDAFFTDLDPAVYIAAEITGIPLAITYTSINTLGEDTFWFRMVMKNVHKVLKKYKPLNKSFMEMFFGDHILKLVPTIPQLETIDSKREDVSYVGHLISKAGNDELSFKIDENYRYVFVYIGVGSMTITKVEQVLPQVFTDDKKLKCIVASKSVKQHYTIGNVEFYTYLNLDKLLPHCDWTICHGGHNTVHYSLLYQVPLMLFPGGFIERRFNSEMVQKAGCGVMGEIVDFTKEWIESKLLLHTELSVKAKELGEQIKACEGPITTVKAIENFVSSKSDRKVKSS